MTSRQPTIGKGVPFDLDRLIESRLLIQANSGAGKSWAVRRLLEQTYGLVQQIIIDPEDEFHTLREKYDYILAGGDRADCPVDIRSAQLLARKLLEIGTSAVIRIYELKKHERTLFVKRFLDELVNAPKALWHPALIVIDEAHMFCPEKGSAESASSVIDLMTRGRKRGFCGVLATQRISKLHKDAAAEANNKLIGRAALDIDMKRAAEELGFNSKAEQRNLRTLNPGEFYVFGPAFTDGVKLIKVGPVTTTHPRAGQHAVPPAPPRGAIKKVLAELSDLPEQAKEEARTIAEAQAEIKSLRHELRAAKKGAPAAPSTKQIEVAEIRGYSRSQSENASILWKFKKTRGTVRAEIEAAIKRLRVGAEILGIEIKSPALKPSVAAISIPEKRAPTPRIDPDVSGNGVSGVQLRILNALAELEAVGINSPPRIQVALFSGYTNASSTGFAKAVSSLSSTGMINYPSTGTIELSDDGRSRVKFVDTPPTTEDLHERIKGLISTVQWRVLSPLIECYPEDMSREDLAAESGYGNLSSTGFAKSISRLSSLGLIKYPFRGRAKASTLLFLESR